MTAVNLKASGYTWRCPECRAENYTGAAPSSVCCSKCNGLFDVGSLVHRRQQKRSDGQQDRSESEGGQQSLFEALQAQEAHSSSDEIPF